ncbi:MAG: hypothetical protein Q9227_001276 [Pyrenula ochraceoflavens]
MSVTTTDNPIATTLRVALADYDVHHSGAEDRTAPGPNLNVASTVENPSAWPVDHRRIPPYRPVNMELDMEIRPAGLNGLEWGFINVMFTGVRTQSHLARLWGATGGRLFPNMFKYKIGGEF